MYFYFIIILLLLLLLLLYNQIKSNFICIAQIHKSQFTSEGFTICTETTRREEEEKVKGNRGWSMKWHKRISEVERGKKNEIESEGLGSEF